MNKKININNSISNIQTVDIGKVFSLQKKIAEAKRKKNGIETLQQTLEELIVKSNNATQLIAKKISSLNIDTDLPIAQKSEELTQLLLQHQVVIVAGETGCGKTTQLPKICLNAGLGLRGKIAHTQPRRVAATSVASRIASEVKGNVGELVGYAVRFSEKTSRDTRIKLMTDGVLLAELQSDPMLKQYEVIIIDEAHERSLNIDFLLGFLKQLLKRRQELKVIVTSATIDPQSFSKYFDNAPIVSIEGRTYPVEVRYQPIEEQENSGNTDPLFQGVGYAIDTCMSESTGDILIFSHGENEIKNLAQFLKQQNLSQTIILPLFARQGIKEQQQIFNSSNQRKIIIATNVAETSLTIPNIVFVIDIGMARISRYSQRNKIQQLPIEKISQASAEQRKGRCGRICPGICIRLYSQEDYESREEYTLAEIKRTNLSSVVLRLKAMRVKQVDTFPFIQSPDERQWKVAFNLLFELGAMNESREITHIGKRMAQLPLDPQLTRILLDNDLTCINEMLIICSFLSVRDVRMRPHDKQQKADQLHSQYVEQNSDVLSIVKLWNILQQQKTELSSNGFKKWCQKKLINFVGWLEWRNIYFQIKENLQVLGVSQSSEAVESAAINADEIHKALICGFISHIMMKTQERYYQGARGIKIWLHPSSVMFKKNTNWLLSTEMIETDKLYARSNAPIQVEWIEKIAPHLIKSHYQDIHWRKKQGQASAFLNQTLLGLPIVSRRIIDFSQVEKQQARELFLLEGLASFNVSKTFPFLDKNRHHLNQIEEQEKKLRSLDIKVSNEVLAQLYAEVIPSNINNVNGLTKWLKKDWKIRNHSLSFSNQQLSQRQGDSIEEYPSSITIGGVSLLLSYSFAPGEPEDGVTVEIPNVMLQQFRQSDFEWLVPGYLNDKIVSVLKCLPKVIRKQFIPIADTAKNCCDHLLTLDYLTMPFKQTLIETIKKVTGKDVFPQDIDLEQLPEHLRMKFRSQLSNKKYSALALQLSQLQQESKSANTSEVRSLEAQKSSVETKLYSWPKNIFSIEETSFVSGREFRVFKGLSDCGSWVELKEYSNLYQVKSGHQYGVARLLYLNQLRLIKEIKNSWPDRKEIERLSLRFGGFSKLLDWIVMSIISQLITQYIKQHKSSITTEIEFEQLVKSFTKNARIKIANELQQILKLLKQMNNIYLKLSGLKSEVYESSVEDINNQLNDLWTSERINQQGDDLYLTYCRYFKAIESRVARINENFPKEEKALSLWNDWQEWWLDLHGFQTDERVSELLNKLFWSLEEYRVSLFSTNVKTKGSISSKKLQILFEQVEAKLAE